MRVKDNSRLLNLQCECGHALGVFNVSSNIVQCKNENCKQHTIKYKVPEDVYIELVKD